MEDAQLLKQFDKIDKQFEDLMIFLVENIATKDDLVTLEKKVDANFIQLDAKIDRVHGDLRQEIRAVRADIHHIKQDIAALETRIGEDLYAYASDILDMKKSLKELEQKVKEIHPA